MFGKKKESKQQTETQNSAELFAERDKVVVAVEDNVADRVLSGTFGKGGAAQMAPGQMPVSEPAETSGPKTASELLEELKNKAAEPDEKAKAAATAAALAKDNASVSHDVIAKLGNKEVFTAPVQSNNKVLTEKEAQDLQKQQEQEVARMVEGYKNQKLVTNVEGTKNIDNVSGKEAGEMLAGLRNVGLITETKVAPEKKQQEGQKMKSEIEDYENLSRIVGVRTNTGFESKAEEASDDDTEKGDA